jgi:hypothetical protein
MMERKGLFVKFVVTENRLWGPAGRACGAPWRRDVAQAGSVSVRITVGAYG